MRDDERRRRRDPEGRRRRPALRLGGRPPAGDRPGSETVIYEVHVKGFTKRHPGRPRGPARHLRRPRLRAGDRAPHARSASPRSSCCRSTTSPTRSTWCGAGLTNYWGYNSIGFLAPHALYAATGRQGEQVREFKGMVKALHRAGHRGDPRRRLQPHRRGQPPRADALASAGIDNARYYRLHRPTTPRFYMDFTGTGNSLNPLHPSVLRLIMDSPALLGRRRCTSTASASTSPRRWRASSTRSTACRPSSTSSTRTRSCPR